MKSRWGVDRERSTPAFTPNELQPKPFARRPFVPLRASGLLRAGFGRREACLLLREGVSSRAGPGFLPAADVGGLGRTVASLT